MQQGTQATIPPALLKAMPEASLRALKTLVVAGEACPSDLVARYAAGRKMINAYGPTEATVCATMSHPLDPVRDGSENPGSVTIGTPNWNTMKQKRKNMNDKYCG